MSKFRNVMLGALAVVALPLASNALTLSYVNESELNTMSVTNDFTANQPGKVSFNWTAGTWNNPAQGYLDFTTDYAIEINLKSNNTNVFFVLEDITGGSFTRLTTLNSNACSSTRTMVDLRGTCNQIANTVPVWDLRAPLATALDANKTYRLGIFGDSRTTGDIEFTITAVPVPASGVLLAGVLAGLAWRARRKAA